MLKIAITYHRIGVVGVDLELGSRKVGVDGVGDRECVPSPDHFFHLPITFVVVFQINAGYVYMLNTYLSIQYI